MNLLETRIRALIEANGPLPVADYMALCLFDPDHGYYTTRDPFGASGDFITAPEVSQMFGELCAAWLVNGWQEMGRPSDAILVEIGPGRGTLATDLVRTIRQLAPSLAERLHLIEVSDRLREAQKRTLADTDADATHHRTIDSLPETPALIVANELFDALPARQYVAMGGVWRERCVVVRDDALAFGIGAGRLVEPTEAPDGTVREIAPAREALVAGIAARLVRGDGLFLTFDYGHEGGEGDTLQAVSEHGYVDPLVRPGEADLTTHVDFRALARAARSVGCHVVGPVSQGDFLIEMGLLQRAGALGAKRDERGREEIRRAVERLAAPERMGTLFKAMALSGRPRTLPPFPGAR